MYELDQIRNKISLTVVDLFCGAGGFSLGFKQAGFKILLGVDIWDTALETYKINIDAEILNKDVRKLKLNEVPRCDVLIGSPPCPDFSVQRYINKDKRNKKPDLSCVEAFMSLVKKIKPKYWIWENTPQAIKYFPYLPYKIYEAWQFGVPQKRKRVFVGNFIEPKKKPYRGKVAPTIIAWELCGGFKNSNSRGFSQWLGRKPTVEELKRYMGFPENFQIYW